MSENFVIHTNHWDGEVFRIIATVSTKSPQKVIDVLISEFIDFNKYNKYNNKFLHNVDVTNKSALRWHLYNEINKEIVIPKITSDGKQLYNKYLRDEYKENEENKKELAINLLHILDDTKIFDKLSDLKHRCSEYRNEDEVILKYNLCHSITITIIKLPYYE